MQTTSHRVGQPRSISARNTLERPTAALDAEALISLEWAAHHIEACARARPQPAVILRRALEVYRQHLQALEDPNKEASALTQAGKGNPSALALTQARARLEAARGRPLSWQDTRYSVQDQAMSAAVDAQAAQLFQALGGFLTVTGRATIEQLQELHRLLTEDLISALDPDLKRKPGQDTLAVVGAFLRQEGIQGFLINPRRVRRLERLYSLYVEALLGHLEGGNASAGVLAEIGKTLRAAEVTKDGSALAVRPEGALKELASVALPFKLTH